MIMQLPEDHKVDVALLSSCFRSTSATYKFYWFLSIIECVELGQEEINKREIFARMMANAWYTINYFQVSFGAQDKIQETIIRLQKAESIPLDENKETVVKRLLEAESGQSQRQLFHFDKQVPHYFLSPWIGSKGSKKVLSEISQHGKNNPPYALYDNTILMQPDWVDYIKRNAGILKDFCYWNLTLFLQKRNPNIPDIPNKLRRPEKRGSLNGHKKYFWDIVINELDSVQCIYSGNKMIKGEYVIEHFIPFQFVAHDQMWNLIPADPTFNMSKSAKLPPLESYFDNFYDLQKEALKIITALTPKNKFLEDYYTVFKKTDISKDQYRDCIEPLLTIAHNNGFLYMGE